LKRSHVILLCIGGGVLTALALPLAIPYLSLRELDPDGHMEWLAWIGLIPTLFALDVVKKGRHAFGVGFLSGAAYFYTAIWWVNHAMTAFGGLSFAMAFFALSMLVYWMAFHWGLAYLVAWQIRRRLGWPYYLHFPFVWAAFELMRNYFCTGFPWANLGYLQARHLVVSQLASAFGVYAIAALLVLVNCVIFAAIRAKLLRRPQPVRAFAVTGAVLFVVVVYGVATLGRTRARMAAAPTARVGLVQGNINQTIKNAASDNVELILGRYVPLTLEADKAGADLVVWPEATFPLHLDPKINTLAPARARTSIWLQPLSRAHLLLGASTLEWHKDERGRRQPEVTNSAFLVAPDLKVLKRYTKHHLVPFGEYVPLGKYLPFLKAVVPDFAPAKAGGELITLEIPTVAGNTLRLAPMICFDAIFPEINIAYAKQAPEILVNQTNDAWYGYSSGPYQFLAKVRLRAIESGKAVIRPAYAGVTAVILPTGEVAPGAIDVGPVDPELAPDPAERAKLLVADVPRLKGKTLYTTIGDVFAYTSAIFTVLALVLAKRRPVNHGRSHPGTNR
jgi:apolipoprotein N-acyltransferase